MADNSDFFNINNFTPRAKRVLYLAQNEAKRLNHDYIGTEHILLGLLATNEGVAIEVLKSMNLNLAKLRLEVEKAVGTGGETKIEGNLPITSGVNDLLNLAVKEAQSMNYNFVGTEHILLALLQMTDSVSARILNNMKIDIKQLKKKKLPANEIDRRVRECAMHLDISHLMERKPRALSSSQKIRVALGAAALKMPRVVVLEDFFGITHPDYHETLQKAFSEATAALGLTVLFYTAQPAHAKAMGARIVEVN